ncbi:MAG: hypothetical protein K2R93_04025 [Gemmatimonadaceae bacterium]|nr:hypothetical protein [Gemmatimonadaceae bacterium]
MAIGAADMTGVALRTGVPMAAAGSAGVATSRVDMLARQGAGTNGPVSQRGAGVSTALAKPVEGPANGGTEKRAV